MYFHSFFFYFVSGWTLEGKFAIKWFKGEQYPADFEIMAVEDEGDDDGDNEYILDNDSDSGGDDDDYGCFIYYLPC